MQNKDALSPRENVLAILNHDQPDYYGDMMDAAIEVPDPVLYKATDESKKKMKCDSRLKRQMANAYNIELLPIEANMREVD